MRVKGARKGTLVWVGLVSWWPEGSLGLVGFIVTEEGMTLKALQPVIALRYLHKPRHDVSSRPSRCTEGDPDSRCAFRAQLPTH